MVIGGVTSGCKTPLRTVPHQFDFEGSDSGVGEGYFANKTPSSFNPCLSCRGVLASSVQNRALALCLILEWRREQLLLFARDRTRCDSWHSKECGVIVARFVTAFDHSLHLYSAVANVSVTSGCGFSGHTRPPYSGRVLNCGGLLPAFSR